MKRIYNKWWPQYFSDMQLWLDTSNFDCIALAEEMGILSGVTTNPAIVANSSLSVEELLDKLLSLQQGLITVQVTGKSASEMVLQGEALHRFSPRVVVKVPVTREGLKVMHTFSKGKIPTMATAVFDENQVLLAARAGADYIAPYFSPICESDMDGIERVQKMLEMLRRYELKAQLLIASLRSAEQVKQCSALGAAAVTLNEKVFHSFIEDHPMTLESLHRFEREWKNGKKSRSLPL